MDTPNEPRRCAGLPAAVRCGRLSRYSDDPSPSRRGDTPEQIRRDDMAACLNSAFASDPLAFDSDVIVIQTCHLGGRLEVAAIVDPDSNPAERPPLDPHATHREGPHRSSSGHARRCWPSAALRWRQRSAADGQHLRACPEDDRWGPSRCVAWGSSGGRSAGLLSGSTIAATSRRPPR